MINTERRKKKKPVFVVVFMGAAVKLISSNRAEFKPEDRNYLEGIASTISEMPRSGIRMEACLAAAHYFGVEPSSILPDIEKVGSGWVSEIGYQAGGYRLVPVY